MDTREPNTNTETSQQQQYGSMSKQTTFLRWLNWRLDNYCGPDKHAAVTDLSYDLRSGVVLHQVVAVLTGQPSIANHADSRLDRLGNLQSLINILQRERTQISEDLDTQQILSGDLEQTLKLVWIIIVRFELQEKFTSSEWNSYSIDQILVVWITTTLSKSSKTRQISPPPALALNSFQHVFQDGSLLCQLLLTIDPNLPGILECTQVADLTGQRRWSVLLRVIENRFQVPQLFSADDVANKIVDNDCILLYLSLLYLHLSPQDVTPDLVDKQKVVFNPELPVCAVNSPVKQRFGAKLNRDISEGMDGWMRSMEDALSWILEAEEHLNSVHNLGNRNIQTVRTKFYAHEDFMLELQNHQQSVGKLLNRGKELIGCVQDPQRQIEIRLQSKLLLDRWEKVRDLAMQRQSSLHQLIMSLQMEQITSLKEWMTNTEDRISRLDSIGTQSSESARQQLKEATEFQVSLEAQHAAVSSIANFILVETDDADNIEDQLAGIGERWSMISRCIEERMEILNTVVAILTNQEYLDTYLDKVTLDLKSMENELEMDSNKIQTQQSLIKDLEGSLSLERSRLSQTDMDFDALQMRSPESSPVVSNLAAKIEFVHDRWGVVVEKLFAQKSRLSNLKSATATREFQPNSGDELCESKRARLSQDTKQEFRKCYARILSWSETVLSRLEHNVTQSLPFQDQNLLYEESAAELVSGKQLLCLLLNFSIQLDKGGVDSEDPDSIDRQVQGATHQLDKVKARLQALKSLIDFQVDQEYFEELSRETYKFITNITSFLDESEGAATVEDTSDSDELYALAVERGKAVESVAVKLDQIRQIGDRIAQHPECSESHTVKEDLESLCQSFQAVQQRFAQFIDKLEGKQTTDVEKKDIIDKDIIASTDHLKTTAVEEKETANIVDSYKDSSYEKLNVIGDKNVSDHSGKELSEENSDNVKDSDEKENDVKNNYEECTVNLTLTIPRLNEETKGEESYTTEAYVTMMNQSQSHSTTTREISELELNLDKCDRYLQEPFYLEDTSSLEDILREAHSHLKLLADAFVPASLTDDEASDVLDRLLEVKKKLRSREKDARAILDDVTQVREEISGLSLWMAEVNVFLGAEEPALGDLQTLEAQLKESNALQEDIVTLEPNITNIQGTGKSLIARCKSGCKLRYELEEEISGVVKSWDTTVQAALTQNQKLRSACEKTREVLDLIHEINTFLDQLEQELPLQSVVTDAPELSQRTYKLLQLRDKTDRKSSVLNRLSTTVSQLIESESEGEGGGNVGGSNVQPATASTAVTTAQNKPSALEIKLSEVQTRWSTLTEPVTNQYTKMREASTDYGEFKTLVAQESDWLDRLEKKLRRSSKCAADAEEISEELDDLENCLNNRPGDRLDKLKRLAASLSEKDVLISPVQTEADRLEKRWETLEGHAKKRIKSLEECITEAQEWECKILSVQDWLAEKDAILSSHLEHELTAQDLPDENQYLLREFEDKENILSAMDEQVDAYRESGKEEAATRLEDQLILIHAKFQELSSKFELFQQPSDYGGKLGRITRQLKDIQRNMYLTELISHEAESIHGQLHHTKCIYNALADIKPEVESTIKMGRKLVDTGSVADGPDTTRKIDALKELFNVLGAQVTESREILQRALELSEQFSQRMHRVNVWLRSSKSQMSGLAPDMIKTKLREMRALKNDVNVLLSLKQEFVSLCNDDACLTGLKDALKILYSDWAAVLKMINSKLPESNQLSMADLDISEDEASKVANATNGSLNSTGSSGDESILLSEFRDLFQEISTWLEDTEERINGKDQNIGEQIIKYQPKVDQLGDMASKLLDRYSNNREDIEPEMENLGQRWESILGKILKQANQSSDSSEVLEEIKSSQVQLETLPEEPEQQQVSCRRRGSDQRNKPGTPEGSDLNNSATSDPEEISTLPEDSFMSGPPGDTGRDIYLAEGNIAEHSELERDSNADGDNSTSSEKSKTSSKRDAASPSRNSSSKESSPSKIPRKTAPATKPKPQWYVDSMRVVQDEVHTIPVVEDTTFAKQMKPKKPSSIPLRSPGGGKVPMVPEPGSQPPPVQQVTVAITSLPLQQSMPQSTKMYSPPQQQQSKPTTLTYTVVQPVTSSVVACSSPVSTVLPSVDTSPTLSPMDSTGGGVMMNSALAGAAPQSILDDIDKQNAEDNAIIDRLLRSASEDIEDVRIRSSYTSSRCHQNNKENHEQDIKEFRDKFDTINARMVTARRKMDTLELESEYPVRNDLIDLEVNELEADVATTISRGDTLVLMVHRFNMEQGEELKNNVTSLRDAWNQLKAFAEEKKIKSAKEAETLKLLRDKLEKMKNWLDSVIKIIKSKKSEEERIHPARKEVDRKAGEIKLIESIVATIKPIDKLGDMKQILIAVRGDWDILKDLATPTVKAERSNKAGGDGVRRSKSKSPGDKKTDRSVPDELFTRTIRVQEALAAVRNQLDTSVLKERNYESLELQAQTLDKIKEALDTLRPKVKKTMSDMDHISGGLSMEYFDKLTAMGEKLREDWNTTNDRYVERRSVWRVCDQEMRAFTALEHELNNWLVDIEQFIKDIKKNSHDEPENRLNSLSAEVENTEHRVKHLADLGNKITAQIGATQARDIFNRFDTVRKRWRCVYTELNLHNNNTTAPTAKETDVTAEETASQPASTAASDINANIDNNPNNNINNSNKKVDNPVVDDVSNSNLNTILSWCEEALDTGSQPVNLSEQDALADILTKLKKYISELPNQRSALDELGCTIGQNSNVYISSQAKLQKINFLLPKKLATLREHKDKLGTMVDSIREKRRFVQDLQNKFNTAKSNEDNNSIKVAVGEIEYSVQKLFNDFSLLEKEIEKGEHKVNPRLLKDLTDLKQKWTKLNNDVKLKQLVYLPIPTTRTTLPNSSPTSGKDMPKTSSSYSVSSVTSQASAASSVSQTASEWACRSTNTGTSCGEQWATSPTTGTNSPMSEEAEEVPALVHHVPVTTASKGGEATLLANKTNEMLTFLKNLTSEMVGTKQQVDVMDTEAVGKELDRIRSLLSHLDSKKAAKNELMLMYENSSVDHGTDTKHEVNTSWSKLHQTLMSRKTELTTMLEHTDNLQSKGQEVSDWLTRLESMLSGAGVGRTRDTLLKQIRDVNQIHRELQQYAHHVALLSQACNRLISIYSRDDTSRISEKNQELTGRYSALSSGCAARGKSLQAALQSLNKLDQDLAEFRTWLSTIETKGGGKSEAVNDLDAAVIEELRRRWTDLQNRMLNLASIQSKKDKVKSEELDKFELYMKEKTKVLENEDIGKSLSEIQQQIKHHDKIRNELKKKEERMDKLLTNPTDQLREEWKKLKDLADDWDTQLREAERATLRVEASIQEAETKMVNLETNSTEWSLPPSLDTAGEERDEVEVTLAGLNQVEELVLAAKMQSDTKPYIQVGDRLATLEKRLSALKESAAHRREQLSSLVVQVDPSNQEFLKEAVPPDWERCLTEENIPYYSHHTEKTTSWDHPEFTSLFDSIAVMNTVKYCAYRVALKLRKVQQKLCLDLLDIEAAVVCFEAHGLTADKHDLSVAVPEVVTILTSIYETLYQCEPEEVEVPLCVDLCLNWLLNVFDSQRTGFLRVLSLKIGLVVMCRGPLEDKYNVMFEMATGGEKRLDQRRLGLLIYDCVQIPKYLGEIALFGGSNIEPSVRSCLRKSSQVSATWVDCLEFMEWLAEEPQSLVWLPVLHRLSSAETATHDVRCKICRAHPIIGFRYHCKKCFNLDICHGCFFLGKSIKGHKAEHPMIEYCTSTSKTDNARHLLQSFRNSFRSRKYFKKKQSKLGYLPVQTVAEGDNFESPALSPNLSWESRDFPASITESMSSKLAGGEETSLTTTSNSSNNKQAANMSSTSNQSNLNQHDILGSEQHEEDEHFLIATYCKMLTTANNNNDVDMSGAGSLLLQEVDTRLDTMEKEEVEQMLNQLKEENNRLESEYQELVTANQAGQSNNAVTEEKSLRQQKNRLEARLAILEDHNRQLEAQLDRLRQFVQPEPVSPAAIRNTRFVVAAELHEGEGVSKKSEEMVVRRPPSHADSVMKKNGGRKSSTNSAKSPVISNGSKMDVIAQVEKIPVEPQVHQYDKSNGEVAVVSSAAVSETVGGTGDRGDGVTSPNNRLSGESSDNNNSERNSATSGSLNLSQHTLDSQVLGTSAVVRRITGFHFKTVKSERVGTWWYRL